MTKECILVGIVCFVLGGWTAWFHLRVPQPSPEPAPEDPECHDIAVMSTTPVVTCPYRNQNVSVMGPYVVCSCRKR